MAYRILFIHDHAHNPALVALLKTAGLDVLCIPSHSSIDNQIDRYHPHLMVIQCPDAPRLCATVRKNDRFRMVPIVLALDHDTTDEACAAYRAGAEGVLFPAWPDPLLLETILALLRIRRIYHTLRESKTIADSLSISSFNSMTQQRNRSLILEAFKIAEKNAWYCSVISVSVSQTSSAFDREEVLAAFITVSKEIATRPSDAVLQYSENRFVIILDKTDPTGGAHVKALLEAKLGTLIQLNHYPKPLIAFYTFPDDAPTSQGFYDRLFMLKS